MEKIICKFKKKIAFEGLMRQRDDQSIFPCTILQTTRHPELFEISPRPFSGQALRNNGGFQYQRIPPTPPAAPGAVPLPPQPLVPDFPPRNLPPHQAADLFLNQIGLEQVRKIFDRFFLGEDLTVKFYIVGSPW